MLFIYLFIFNIPFLFCRKDESSVFELNTKALVAHTKRIFRFIHRKSNLSIEQFCFGSAYVQLNPVSQKLKRMDPSTWKKEGIADAWSGPRGLKRACCKNCCVEVDCEVKYTSIQFDGVNVSFKCVQFHVFKLKSWIFRDAKNAMAA